jgi:glucosamine kinase
MPSTRAVASVDLGKTGCRVARADDGSRELFTGHGSPGLATDGGVDAAFAAVLPLIARLNAAPTHIGIGAAGALSAPGASAEFAARIATATHARVAVTSDVVTAHIGALNGQRGVLLIAGTGAAAFGVDERGARLIDGWGPDLGDFGSGSWLGREAARAVLRAAEGTGPATVLTDSVRGHLAPAEDIHAWLSSGGPVARRLATLAPLVLDAARDGDEVALTIAADAVRHLTSSAVAASASDVPVALHGGLIQHSWLRARLTSALEEGGRTVAPARGDALDGAALLTDHLDLPHERFVHRAG